MSLILGVIWLLVWADGLQASVANLTQATGTKRLLYYGWGIRDTQYVRDHWQEMERMPFDGVGISIAIDRTRPTTGDGVTGNLLGWQVMGPRAFRVEDFREAIADLKAARFRRFRDNFLPVALSSSVSAADLVWFDDARWRIVANTFGVVAAVAAETGIRGLILDPEHYGTALFSYPAQRPRTDRPFAAYAEVARRRGREVMAAITAHLPEPVILALFGYTLALSELQRGRRLEEAQYGLLPTFYDGFLDVMPEGARFVDGYEFAYGFKGRHQFLDGYRRIHEEAIRLSAVPEHYRRKVRAGFGLWLDYRNRPDYFTPEEFRRALRAALDVSDGYVWLYTQGPRFFPPSGIHPAYIEALALR